MIRFLPSLILVMLFCLTAVTASPALANNKYASLVMDADTGMILHQRHANKKLHPASLTKIMTLLLTFDAIESGQLDFGDRIRISRHAANMVPSKIGLPAGSSIKVRDAIYALITKSANDVAVALAEHIGGSEENFAVMMTRRARQLGMHDTRFMNASGLHNPRQISTARDMAKMARAVIVNYPSYYRFFSTKEFTYNGKTYRNHNRLLDSYRGIDGMKTGYINASGFNLIASAKRDNRRIIGVVFGGRTSKTRNTHMASLLDIGFNKIGTLRVAYGAPPIPERKPFVRLPEASLAQASIPHHQLPEALPQGDFDDQAYARLDSGWTAIAAHKRYQERRQAPSQVEYQHASLPSEPVTVSSHVSRDWAIQVGAYSSRARSDQMAQKAMSIVSPRFASAAPFIAPMKISDQWVFRSRIQGFTKAEAFQACQMIEKCMTIAPR